MKKVFNRKRPNVINWNRIINLRSTENNGSFPSGDTIQAAHFASFIYFTFGNTYWLFLIPMTAFSRIYYQCHWINDTIIGALIGLITGYLTYSTVSYLYEI